MYRSLAPEENLEVDKDNTYCEALAWALENKTIKNIAVTGIYGAGKTSILEKFKRTYSSKYNFFNVSLAAFNDVFENSSDEQSADKKRNNIQNIEECILQQIFYQIDSKKIPRSRFKKITYLSEGDLIYFESIFYLLLCLGLNIFYPNYTLNLYYLIENIKCTNLFQLLSSLPVWIINILAVLFLIVFIILTVYVIHRILYYFIQNIHFKKISVNKIELETDNREENNDKSVFNKYMDEIIYFFEATDYDVFIFEDLDRFEKTEIFIKLRELNTIVNNYENIHRRIVFIYAIKDDMFKTDEERTKFFDFIVPVIPFLNSSNSSEILNKLIAEMKNEPLNVNISQKYILDICPFLNDMRLLKNITNEFELYKHKLIKQNIDDEKLLSMIIYKNMCSQDFSLLQKNDGFVYLTLKNKDKLIKDRINKINEEIATLKNERKNLELSVSNSMNDLEYQLTGLLSSKSNGYVNSKTFLIYYENGDIKKQFTVAEYLSSENVMYGPNYINKISYKYNTTNSFGSSDGYNGNIQLDNDIRDFIKNIPCKKAKLNIYYGQELNRIKKEIDSLNANKINLKTKSYVELLEIVDVSYDEKYNDSQYNIAKFMLRRGYIDETFSNYISYFHEGRLSINENNFILSVKNNESIDFTYKLKNIDLIIRQMDIRDFKETKFYNFYLVKYILENINSSVDQHFHSCIDMAISTLCRDTDENKHFLEQFIVYLNKSFTSEQYRNFVGILCEAMCKKSKKAYFILQSACNSLENHYKETLLHEVLLRLNIPDLKKQNENYIISDMILFCKNFISLADDIPNIKKIIEHLKIYFDNLEINEKTDLVKYIFEEGYFVINENCMQNINKLYFENNTDFNTMNYSFIKAKDCKWLNDKINRNINDYWNYLLNMDGGEFKDNPDDIKELLKFKGPSNDEKRKLIKKEQVEFKDFDSIDCELWGLILEENKIFITWENINKYFDEYELDKTLESFIKNNIEKLLESSIDSLKLAVCLLNNRQLAMPLLQGKVFDKIKVDCDKIELTDKEEYKLLVNKDLVNHSLENFDWLSNKQIDLLPIFLQNAYDDNFDLSDCTFDDSIIKEIVNSNINQKIKKEVINSISLDKVSDKCLNLIADFISQSYTYEEFGFENMISIVDRLEECEFIQLVNTRSKNLSTDNLIELLSNNNAFSDLLIYRKKPKYQKSNDTYKFFEILKEKNIISSYTKKDDYIIVYTKKR